MILLFNILLLYFIKIPSFILGIHLLSLNFIYDKFEISWFKITYFTKQMYAQSYIKTLTHRLRQNPHPLVCHPPCH